VGLLLWGLRHTSLFIEEEQLEEQEPDNFFARLGHWLRAFIP